MSGRFFKLKQLIFNMSTTVYKQAQIRLQTNRTNDDTAYYVLEAQGQNKLRHAFCAFITATNTNKCTIANCKYSPAIRLESEQM